MKWLVLILLLVASFTALCHPRDSTRVLERKKAKIERQRKRIMNKWDERTTVQKKNDRRALMFLAISAAILANSMSHKE